MSTAALIVEILVIGVQAGMTILLWAIGLLGYGVVHKPLSLLDAHGGSWRWIPLLSIVALAGCYSLGILMDRVMMVLFSLFRPILKGPLGLLERLVKEPCRRDEALVRTLREEGRFSSFLQDVRGRLRVARATVFHLILISLAFLLTPHLDAILPRRPGALGLTVGLGLLLAAAVFLGWAILYVTYDERLRQAGEVRSGRG